MLFAPYHAVVRRIVRHAYSTITDGNPQRLAAQFRRDAVLEFSGDHAMGGEQRGRAAIEAWFGRFGRLFPGLALTPGEMVVSGGPWDTTAAVRFSVKATLPDGTPYANAGVQYVRLRWGSIVEDRLFEDTAALERALQRIAASGRPEALEPPLRGSAVPGP
jgi:ketosteroid isomerase-like protein